MKRIVLFLCFFQLAASEQKSDLKTFFAKPFTTFRSFLICNPELVAAGLLLTMHAVTDQIDQITGLSGLKEDLQGLEWQ